MDRLIKTFLELAKIDEMHPHEDEVLRYVEEKLQAAHVTLTRSEGGIAARIPGVTDEVIGICGHVDIAAPLNDRQVLVEDDIIKTDGSALLGGDDKTAVAAMLELATELDESHTTPHKTIELIFTVGEEAGLVGARAIDVSLLKAKEILVLDWLGRVNSIVAKSPAYYKLDVTFEGKDAHPAEWQTGRNAGKALMQAASDLQQGEYKDGVIFNIGIVRVGNARNKVPGHAKLQAELRGFEASKVKASATEISEHFQQAADKHKIKATISVTESAPAFILDESGSLYKQVTKALETMGLKPELTETYGCFDGNIFSAKGISVLMLGAGYYHPHSPDEYLKISEFKEMYALVRSLVN